MKVPSVIQTATAISFAAGIALAGLGNQTSAESRVRRETGEPSGRNNQRKSRNIGARPPLDPTLAHAAYAGALTATGPVRA